MTEPVEQHRKITGKIVIATHNAGKLREMRELLALYGVEAVSAGELKLPEPEETGAHLRKTPRSRRKPRPTPPAFPLSPTISGLAVDMLGGAPGIHSARWAGKDKNFARAMEVIDSMLRDHGATKPAMRTAHFVSALCVAWPDGHLEEFEAIVEGTLVWPPRGDAGFGYDPMFLPDGHDRTFGEMSSDEKHGLPPRGQGLSHRARAFMQLAAACLEQPR